MTQPDTTRGRADGLDDDRAPDRGAAAQGTKDEAASVAGTAQQEAGRVADEARQQARNLTEDARQVMREQARTQTDNLGETMGTMSQQMQALAEGRPEDAGRLGEVAGTLADRFDGMASRINELGFEGSIDELQRFARRRPGAFLAGAAALGFAASRLTQGAKQAQDTGVSGTDANRSTQPGGGARTHAGAQSPPATPGGGQSPLPPPTPASSETSPLPGGTQS